MAALHVRQRRLEFRRDATPAISRRLELGFASFKSVRRLGTEPAFGGHSLAQLFCFATQAIIEPRLGDAQGGLRGGPAPHLGLKLAAELLLARVALGFGLPIVVNLHHTARELALGSQTLGRRPVPVGRRRSIIFRPELGQPKAPFS